jgi:DNA-binding LacI/PurR family transcriptional regulator
MEWEQTPIFVPPTALRFTPSATIQTFAPTPDATIIQNYDLGLTTVRCIDDYVYMGQTLLQHLIRLGYSEIVVYVNDTPEFRQYLVDQGFLDA